MCILLAHHDLSPSRIHITTWSEVCMIVVANMMMMMKTRVFSRPFSLVPSLKYPPRGVVRASRDHVRADNLKSHSPSGCSCGRKHFLEAASPTKPLLPLYSPNASRSKVVYISFYPFF